MINNNHSFIRVLALAFSICLIVSISYGWGVTGYCYYADSTGITISQDSAPIQGLKVVAGVLTQDPFQSYHIYTYTDSSGHYTLSSSDPDAVKVEISTQNTNFICYPSGFIFYPPYSGTMDFIGTEYFTPFDFLTSSDTTQWVISSPPGASVSGQPEISWLPGYDNASGVIKMQFTSANQGVKITLQMQDWYVSREGKWYLMKARIRSDSNTPNSITASGFLFKGVPPEPTDLEGHVLLSVSTTWVTLRNYQEALIWSSMYPQLIFRNNSTSPVTLYIDSVEIKEVTPPSAQ